MTKSMKRVTSDGREHVKKALEKALRITGMTQTEFANALSRHNPKGRPVGQGTVSRWLNDGAMPSFNAIEFIDRETRGKVNLFDFAPQFKDTYSRRRKPLKTAA